MTNLYRIIGYLAATLVELAMAGAFGAVSQDENGWTVVTASGDSRIIYVSSSDGNDADDGLSEANAKATVAAGEALLRDGYPDHILFKRGDTWTNENFGTFSVSGRGATEPILIGTYGTGARPRFITDPADNFIKAVSAKAHIYVIGLHLEVNNRETNDTQKNGIDFTVTGSNFLVEDCYVDGFRINITIQVNAVAQGISDVTIRRNVIVDAWGDGPAGSHSQGVFNKNVDGLLIEENIFDHNGWHKDYQDVGQPQNVQDAYPTIFNHNIYISEGCRNVTVKNNVFSRGSSMGTKIDVEAGVITCTDNLYFNNSVASQFGVGSADVDVEVDGITLYAANNVMVEHVARANANGLGPNIQNIKQGYYRNNFMGQRPSSDGDGAPWAFWLDDHTDGVGINNFTIDGNILYDWRARTRFEDPLVDSPDYTTATVSGNAFTNNIWVAPTAADNALFETDFTSSAEMTYSGNQYYHPGSTATAWFEIDGVAVSTTTFASTVEAGADFTNPSFTDATRDVTDYITDVLSGTDIGDLRTLWESERNGNWNSEYHAPTINDYIRAGFDMNEYTPASAKKVMVLQ